MSHRIFEFDTWRPYYGGKTVHVYQPGTTTPVSLFLDEALSVAADNPQILDSLEVGGISYGKFLAPVYTGVPYYLVIDGAETGVERPGITDIIGEDASKSVVKATHAGAVNRELEDWLSDAVWVEAFGDLDASSSNNTALINAAIAAAAAMGKSFVEMPAGTIPYNPFSISEGVVLRGRGLGTILQCQAAQATVTIAGPDAGLTDLVLDGVNLTGGSIGLYAKAKDDVVLQRVTVKRFEKGIYCQGGNLCDWQDVNVDNCVDGAKLVGDSDAGGGADGEPFRFNSWRGGKVSNCTGTGVQLLYQDRKIWNNALHNLLFNSNTGTALQVKGARWTTCFDCNWSGNAVNLDVSDGADATMRDENGVVGLSFEGGSMDGGDLDLAGVGRDIVFRRFAFYNVEITLAQDSNVVAQDCFEDELTRIAGAGNKWLRSSTIDGTVGASFGLATSATYVTTWQQTLEPGQRCLLVAKVVCNGRNVNEYGIYHIARAAHRPGSTLAYINQTANFTVGDIITGGTTGATARIVADSDLGATGTLTLKDIDGEFVSGEVITGSLGGSADVSGTLSHQSAALLGSITNLIAVQETDVDFDARFVVNAGAVGVEVRADASKTLEITTEVAITKA
jgi:hypothetical protein